MDMNDLGVKISAAIEQATDRGQVARLVAQQLRIFEKVGDDADLREGIQETPDRVAKAWEFWTSGYAENAEAILKVFEDGGENYDEMVIVKDIPVYSKCEHHLADIFGTATVAYIPNGKIVGLSKLSRLVNMHARRLQVQERLTNDVAEDIHRILKPKGVGVLVRARHMCMESRGICQQGHHTITTALRGVLKNEPAARAEFMSVA
jgi:GTP cyclohydrolase IA